MKEFLKSLFSFDVIKEGNKTEIDLGAGWVILAALLFVLTVFLCGFWWAIG